MNKLPISLFLLFLIATPCFGQESELEEVRETYKNLEFSYQKISGIGHEEGVTRRDPSDIIKVGDVYYVYYTKIYGRSPGYWGTVWYATSKDKGYSWEEQGEILGLGEDNAFDSQATFTPNIIYAQGKYYLYYTGVKPTPENAEGKFENNSSTDITAIGVAASDSPDGPFTRETEKPILKVSVEPEKFDSYRVDDAALLYRNGIYWLYYKGRSRMHGSGGPTHTKMGVAFSKDPAGRFIKYDKPLLDDSHEVLIWKQNVGVGALATFDSALEYASDGIDFLSNKFNVNVENLPKAPGLYRKDLTDYTVIVEGIDWGISMIHNGDESYLIRFEADKR